MYNHVKNVLKLINSGDRILDVGGGASTFPQADAVIDILSYESCIPDLPQEVIDRLAPEFWYQGDICDAQVWNNFNDKEFDFVICSHTLEDVRDPIFVCSQLIRVAKAGYIEVPSRFRECSKTSPDACFTGWEHHHWIVDVEESTLIFIRKNPWIHAYDFLGEHRRHHLLDYHKQFLAVHWIGSFDYRERINKGHETELENLFYYFDHYPYNQNLSVQAPPVFHFIGNVPHSGKTLEWVDEYLLEIEREIPITKIIELFQIRERKRVNPFHFPSVKKLASKIRYCLSYLAQITGAKKILGAPRKSKRT